MIRSNCNFSNIESKIEFYCSKIESIRSFNDCIGDITLKRTSIIKITPTTIRTKKLEINKFSNDDFDFKKIFFVCNFPELMKFSIRPETERFKFSFEDSYLCK